MKVYINHCTVFPHTDDHLMSPDQLNFKFFTLKGNSVLNILLIHSAMWTLPAQKMLQHDWVLEYDLKCSKYLEVAFSKRHCLVCWFCLE